MGQEALSAIEQYRLNWKPDEAKIAEYKSLYHEALRKGNWYYMILYFDALLDAMRPPRHLPIKNLDQVEL